QARTPTGRARCGTSASTSDSGSELSSQAWACISSHPSGVAVPVTRNGIPPGIGKSTLAQRYVDQQAGVLDLDIDRLRGLIGKAQDRFEETGEIVRPLALSMASTHLSAGYDVIVPPFLGRIGEIERFEALAKDCGAVFRE